MSENVFVRARTFLTSRFLHSSLRRCSVALLGCRSSGLMSCDVLLQQSGISAYPSYPQVIHLSPAPTHCSITLPEIKVLYRYVFFPRVAPVVNSGVLKAAPTLLKVRLAVQRTLNVLDVPEVVVNKVQGRRYHLSGRSSLIQ